jgi:hypothetical protein
MMTKVFELKKMAPRIRIFPLVSHLTTLCAGYSMNILNFE